VTNDTLKLTDQEVQQRAHAVLASIAVAGGWLHVYHHDDLGLDVCCWV